jgi:hypothetical protein
LLSHFWISCRSQMNMLQRSQPMRVKGLSLNYEEEDASRYGPFARFCNGPQDWEGKCDNYFALLIFFESSFSLIQRVVTNVK